MPDSWFDERSVSEVVGYILVFALVVTSVSIVTVSGVGTLEDARDSERGNNAERAFGIVADNMADVYERNSPSRSTELDLGEMELFYAQPVRVSVSVDDGSTVETHEYLVRPVEMRVSDRTSLVYEGGAVIREQRTGGVLLREPPFLLDDSRAQVPIIQTTAVGEEGATGTTVLLRGKSTDRELLVGDSDGFESVSIEITSPRYEIWADSLGSRSNVDCTTTDARSRVTCTLAPADGLDAVYVTRQRIELSIIR